MLSVKGLLGLPIYITIIVHMLFLADSNTLSEHGDKDKERLRESERDRKRQKETERQKETDRQRKSETE